MLQNDDQWHRLCREAMREEDLSKLLKIFLELDRATQSRERTEALAEAVREYRCSMWNPDT